MTHTHNIKERKSNDDDIETSETLESFEARWKYAVFPAMVAFFILAAFGFYLIYGMLQRMEDLSENVYRMTEVIQESMPSMNKSMGTMSTDMQQMSSVIQENIPNLDKNIAVMSKDMKNMSYSTSSMASMTQNLSHNVWELNKNVSKPLSMMNKMIPWSQQGTAPTPHTTSYYQVK